MAYRDQSYRLFCRHCESEATERCKGCDTPFCEDHRGSPLMCSTCVVEARARLAKGGATQAQVDRFDNVEATCGLCQGQLQIVREVVVADNLTYHRAWMCTKCSAVTPMATQSKPQR